MTLAQATVTMPEWAGWVLGIVASVTASGICALVALAFKGNAKLAVITTMLGGHGKRLDKVEKETQDNREWRLVAAPRLDEMYVVHKAVRSKAPPLD